MYPAFNVIQTPTDSHKKYLHLLMLWKPQNGFICLRFHCLLINLVSSTQTNKSQGHLCMHLTVKSIKLRPAALDLVSMIRALWSDRWNMSYLNHWHMWPPLLSVCQSGDIKPGSKKLAKAVRIYKDLLLVQNTSVLLVNTGRDFHFNQETFFPEMVCWLCE